MGKVTMNMMHDLFAQLRIKWGSSIYRQLAWSFSFVSLIIILSLGSLLYFYERDAQYELGNQNAFDLARSFTYSSTSWVLASDLAGLQEVLQGISKPRISSLLGY